MARKGVGHPLPAPPQIYRNIRLSPDGQRAAVTVGYPSMKSDIWILDLARGALSRLTSQGYTDFPVWTPDGGRVAFSQFSGSNPAMYWTPADGGGKPELLPASTGAIPYSWTPDGRMLLYNFPGPLNHIWALSAQGRAEWSKPRPLLDRKSVV